MFKLNNIKNTIIFFAAALSISILFACSSPAEVNVADYGNDDEAIYEAISIVADGGIVNLPPVSYINEPILVDKRVTIRGEGHTMSLSGGAATIAYKTEYCSGPAFIVVIDGVVVENFYLRGEPGNIDCGIRVNASRFTARNMTISHMGKDGLRIGDVENNCNYWRLDNVYTVANLQHGIHIHSDYRNANCGVATLLISRDNAVDGVRLGICTGNIFQSVNSSANGGYGIRFGDDARGNIVIGGNIERNANDAQVKFDIGSSGNVVKYMRLDNGEWSDNGSLNDIGVGFDLR
jgi:hypothetical protein